MHSFKMVWGYLALIIMERIIIMEDTSLRDYLEDNLFEEMRNDENAMMPDKDGYIACPDSPESGLAYALVSELGKDATAYTEESLNTVAVSYIMMKLSNRISREIANMNYIINTPEKFWTQVSDQSANRLKEARIPAGVGYMLDLIEEDLTEHIDYIRSECFHPEVLAEYLELNHEVTGITIDQLTTDPFYR